MNYDIKDLIDLEGCDDVTIDKIEIDDPSRTKYIYISKRLSPVFCPECGCRMHSKGTYIRSVAHPIMDDGYAIVLKVSQRKYRCTVKECNTYINERFSFIEANKRTSDVTPVLILNDLKDISLTCAQVARKRKVSETFVHEVVLSYLSFSRLPLPEILCIDEVYLDIGKDARYCVILRDFVNDDIIDILPNRYKGTFEDYFYKIQRKERLNVRYIISDMYEPYLKLPDKYFNNAISVIDSFHVVSWLNNKINLFINEVKKRYQKRDDELRKEKNYKENRDFIKRKDSKEVYLLKNHRWVLLMSDDNIDMDPMTRRVNQLGGYYNTRQIMEMFMALDKHFPILKRLKEKYMAFNRRCLGNRERAREELHLLIKDYRNSDYEIFKEFADILEKRKEEIIASFTLVESGIDYDDTESKYRRMSNGPMEGFNRKPKDMKRDARGFSNFDYVRNRILWSQRKDAHILGSPIPIKEIRSKYKTNKKRGRYNKQ